jgi:hypothetical protein
MTAEFWSKEELRARRAQVQRDIDFNKCMLGMLDSLSEKCIIVGELNRLWSYRDDLDELIARKEKTGDVS